MCLSPPLCLPRVSLKQSLSLQELEQHLNQIRAQVEEGDGGSTHRPLSWYMMPDEENTLAAQVTALTCAFFLLLYCSDQQTSKLNQQKQCRAQDATDILRARREQSERGWRKHALKH